MNESALVLSAFENRLRAGIVLNTPRKRIQPLSRIKTLKLVQDTISWPHFSWPNLYISQLLTEKTNHT